MDTQLKNDQQPGGYSSYQGYGDSHKSPEAVEKMLNRDMMLLEYDTDRDIILGAIQSSLKERNYDEAQAFVEQYRAAAKTDEKFAILARMTSDGLNTQKEAEKVQTVLDATPEDDYEVRLSLSERLYKLIPSDENLAQINRYRLILKKPLIQKDAAMDDAKDPAKVVQKVRSISKFFCKGVCIAAIFWCLLFIGLLVGPFATPGAAVLPGVELIYHGYSLYQESKKEDRARNSVIRMITNTAVLLFITILTFILSFLVF